MNSYCSIFKNSEAARIRRHQAAGPGIRESVISTEFQLNGFDLIALNGGPHFTFSPAISFFVHRDTEQEVDDLWVSLRRGGEKQQCGWLRDSFGDCARCSGRDALG
jgi:predicted 3-demethylubiquinone-9 3-methyltransferase (glyoxalase superfamily)